MPHVPTILNVDPDSTATLVLRQAGFRVREAASGIEALRNLAEKPDLILLTVDPAGEGGLALCRRIKADPAGASVPVLLRSGSFADAEARVEAWESGADGILTEPVDPKELAAHVRAALRPHRQGSAEETSPQSRAGGQVAHDLGNVLLVIGGNVELLLRGLRPDDRLRPLAEEIRRACERADLLRAQLFGLYRPPR